MRSSISIAAGIVLAAAGAAATAAETAPENLPPMQVTATRVAERIDVVPASVTVITAKDLRDRGATDLRTALSLVAGVEGTPGGDAGPAGAVPAMWGLREADAFLLVVDDVPWGGAFNPATPSVDLAGVERIEILRGAAPVKFGATSFVGVIHVIHYAAGEAPSQVSLSGGSYASGGASLTSTLPALGGWRHSLTADAQRQGFATDREQVQRYHLLYRGATDLGDGKFHLDSDVSVLPQGPASVKLMNVAGTGLRNDIPVNANHNPADGKLDQQRYHLAAGYALPTALGDWDTTLALTRTYDNIVRGFLRIGAPSTAPAPADGNDADGYTQKRRFTDLYFDSHLTHRFGETLEVSAGADLLYGNGFQRANNFGYFVSLDGKDAPHSPEVPDEIAQNRNTRYFGGVYTEADWKVAPSVDVLAGLRVNYTREETEGQEGPPGALVDNPSDQRNRTRPSGLIGASWAVWSSGRDGASLYADYRNTYKPLAVDFGPDAETEILKPETADSYEAGVKGHALDGRLEYDVSLFQMDFRNGLTFPAGTPENGGRQRFRGVETELAYAICDALSARASYAYHDARYTHFTTDGGTRVDGNRLEMSPYHNAGFGLIYAPAAGLSGAVIANYIGQRWLDPENTISTGGYTTLDATLAWRFAQWHGVEVRVSGTNLTNRRVPVAASELSEEVPGSSDPGNAAPAWYLLPAVSGMASVTVPF